MRTRRKGEATKFLGLKKVEPIYTLKFDGGKVSK